MYFLSAWPEVIPVKGHIHSVLIKTCIKLIAFSHRHIPGLSISLFNTFYFPDQTDSMIKIINQLCGKSNLYSCGSGTGVPVCILGWSSVMGLQSHFLFKDLAHSYASQDKTMIFVSRVKKIMLVIYHTWKISVHW